MAQHYRGIKAKLAEDSIQRPLKISEKLSNGLQRWVTSPLTVNEINLSGSNNSDIINLLRI